MSEQQNRMTIRGNVISGSQVFANGPAHVHRQDAGTTGELRAALADARDRIVAAGRDEDEQAQLDGDVTAIERELDRDEPRPGVVRGRWEAIRPLLGQALEHSGDIARIGQIVADLLPG